VAASSKQKVTVEPYRIDAPRLPCLIEARQDVLFEHENVEVMVVFALFVSLGWKPSTVRGSDSSVGDEPDHPD
jgi:hypothetical protein